MQTPPQMKCLRTSIKISGRFEMQPKWNVMWTKLAFTPVRNLKPVRVHFTSHVNVLQKINHHWEICYRIDLVEPSNSKVAPILKRNTWNIALLNTLPVSCHCSLSIALKISENLKVFWYLQGAYNESRGIKQGNLLPTSESLSK